MLVRCASATEAQRRERARTAKPVMLDLIIGFLPKIAAATLEDRAYPDHSWVARSERSDGRGDLTIRADMVDGGLFQSTILRAERP